MGRGEQGHARSVMRWVQACLPVPPFEADTLSKRSGALVNSIIASVRVNGDTVRHDPGLDRLRRALPRIQEFGGTIVPKDAKYLTVPLLNAQER